MKSTHAIIWLATLVGLRLLLSGWLWTEWAFLLPPGELALTAGDTETYLAPAETWIETGTWGTRSGTSVKPSAGRMPGYGLIYLFWRLFFEPAGARTALVLLQWVLSLWVAWLLGGWVARGLKQPQAQGPAALLIGTACWMIQYDLRLLTESLSLSVLGLAVVVAWRPPTRGNILLLGLLLAVGVFLRPLMGWFWAGAGLVLAVGLRQLNWRAWAGRLLLFALPLLVFEGVWLTRNRLAFDRWIPLQGSIWADYTYSPVRMALFEFVAAWGGDIVWWEPKSEIRLFLPDSVGGIASHPDNTMRRLPPALVRALGRSLIESLADSTRAAEAQPADTLRQVRTAQLVRRAMAGYRAREPWDYYLKSRLRLLRRYLVRSGTEDLLTRPAGGLPLGELLLKVYFSLLYGLLMTLGWLGLGLWANRRRDGRLTGLLLVLGSYLLLIPWGFRFCEWRYQAPLFPILLAGVAAAAWMGAGWLRTRKKGRAPDA